MLKMLFFTWKLFTKEILLQLMNMNKIFFFFKMICQKALLNFYIILKCSRALSKMLHYIRHDSRNPLKCGQEINTNLVFIENEKFYLY